MSNSNSHISFILILIINFSIFMLANVILLAKLAPFGFINCLERGRHFFYKSLWADWQTGTGLSSQWAGTILGRHCIEMLTGRPPNLLSYTAMSQICDEYIPWPTGRRQLLHSHHLRQLPTVCMLGSIPNSTLEYFCATSLT